MDEETAKAVQEVAKTTGKAVDASEKLGGFLSRVLGDTLVEMGGVLQDWAKFFRYKNLLKIQDKVEALHVARKIEGKTIAIPPRFAIPLIQGASEEDDESIQDMWAALIANATDPGKQLDLKKIFIEVLSSLEPLDVAILRYMDAQGWMMYRNVPSGGISVDALVEAVRTSESHVKMSLLNLHRLGLLVDEYSFAWKDLGTTSFGLRVVDPKTTVRPSLLGIALLKACQS